MGNLEERETMKETGKIKMVRGARAKQSNDIDTISDLEMITLQ